MSLVKSNNGLLTQKTVSSIVNSAISTAASMYGINPTLAGQVAKAAGSIVKSGVNAATSYVKNRNKNTPATVIINSSPRSGGTRRASRNRNAPVAVGSSSRSGRWNNNYRIRNIERVFDMDTTGGIISIPINPGLKTSFPWLSNIAKSYDKYQFHKIVFRYKPTCPSTEPGQVVLAWDYDSLDPLPSNNQEMAQESYWVSTAPWQHSTFTVSLAGIGRLFTRSTLIAGTDLKTYDLGQLLISYPASSTTSMGYVEVEYDLTLYNKQPDFISSVPKTNTGLYLASGHIGIGATVAANSDATLDPSTYETVVTSNTSYRTAAVDINGVETRALIFTLPEARYHWRVTGDRCYPAPITGGTGVIGDPYTYGNPPNNWYAAGGDDHIDDLNGDYVMIFRNTTGSSQTCYLHSAYFNVV